MPSATINLSELTTIRLGGPAEVVTVEARDELPALTAAPHRWLGRGANLLVADDGVSERVLRFGEAFKTLTIVARDDGSALVSAGAAVDLAVMIARCCDGGWRGPEGLAGVPATVGGALRMNAGTSTCWMSDWVTRIEALLPGESAPRWIERSAIPAAYRQCGLPPGTVFLGCELVLAPGDPARLRAEASRLKKAKATSQPLAQPSAGCIFRNPRPDLPAGRLIDSLGLKGTRIGGVCVSPVHANFIVNDQGGTTTQVCELITLVRERAWSAAGVVLELEVETWNCPASLRLHPDLSKEAA